MSQKSTKIVTQKRVFEIHDWILEGKPDYKILRDCVEQFGIGERQAKNLLEKAYKIWYDAVKVDKEHKRMLKIGELKSRMQKMKEEYKNTPMGMRVLLQYDKHIDKLEGIIPDKSHVIKGDNENPIVFTNLDDAEKREARIAELLKKAMGK